MKLSDYALGDGQFGEGGMIRECFRRIGTGPSLVAEFGAGSDPALLNTLSYADSGVPTLWAETDDKKIEALQAELDLVLWPNVTLERAYVTDVDDWLGDWDTPDLLSIDVDGEDYHLFERMDARPKVLVIEHHPMIPAHVSYVGGPDVGASALALCELAQTKDYSLVGTTHCNCIFVRFEDYWAFDDLDTDLVSIFEPSAVTFAVSNVLTGDYVMVGPWPFGRGEDMTCE
jgi:hypothetical protein